MAKFKISCANEGTPRTKKAKLIANDGDYLERKFEIELSSIQDLISLMQEEKKPLILYGTTASKFAGEILVYNARIE